MTGLRAAALWAAVLALLGTGCRKAEFKGDAGAGQKAPAAGITPSPGGGPGGSGPGGTDGKDPAGKDGKAKDDGDDGAKDGKDLGNAKDGPGAGSGSGDGSPGAGSSGGDTGLGGTTSGVPGTGPSLIDIVNGQKPQPGVPDTGTNTLLLGLADILKGNVPGNPPSPGNPPGDGPLNGPTKPTPLALDMNGDGIITFAARVVRFDIFGDGKKLALPWLAPGDAWLALDLDGDGWITSGHELFGNASVTPGREDAPRDGFDALARYDDDGDGWITEKDPVFRKMVLWHDKDGDGRGAPTELRRLVRSDVVRIGVKAGPASHQKTPAGALVGLTGIAYEIDGTRRLVGDVFFTEVAP